MLPHRQQSTFEAAPHRSRHSIHTIPGLCSPPSPFPLRVLWSACACYIVPALQQPSGLHPTHPNSDALDALLDRPLLNERVEVGVKLDDELLLKLELELDLELFSAKPLLLPKGFGW